MEWNNGWEMISAIATLFGAFFAVKTLKRNHERQKKEGSINALKEFVNDHNQNNERVKELFKEINSARIDNLDHLSSSDLNKISDFLNEMERISVAISMNVYDRGTFIDVWGNPFIQTYKLAEKTIKLFRSKVASKNIKASESLYKEFEEEYLRIQKIMRSDSIFIKAEKWIKAQTRRLPN